MSVQMMHHRTFLLLLMVMTIAAMETEPNSTMFGFQKYTEYRPGTGSIILTSSHGGTLKPEDIPDRQAGCWDTNGTCIWQHLCGQIDGRRCRAATLKDKYTLYLAEIVREELFSLTGHQPHLIINRLHRSKMDANRNIDEAAQGDAKAEQAWRDFHSFIKRAKEAIDTEGLLLDFHGQTHPEGYVELGYLLRGTSLDSGEFHANMTSLRRLSSSLSVHSKTLIQGSRSLGHYIQEEGYASVPSPANPGPRGAKYYSGGYITKIHGSFFSGKVDAIQIESPKYVRNSDKGPAYARALARAINNFKIENFIKTSNDKRTVIPVVDFSTKSDVRYTPSSVNFNTSTCGSKVPEASVEHGLTNTGYKALRYRRTSLLLPALVLLLGVHIRYTSTSTYDT